MRDAAQHAYDGRAERIHMWRQRQVDDLPLVEMELEEHKRDLEACVAECNRLEELLKASK